MVGLLVEHRLAFQRVIRSILHIWPVWLVMLIAALLRFWRLSYPSELYFDEVYHVPAAQLMSKGDWSAFEWWHPPVDGTNYFDWLHPPLAKYLQAASIWFGREWFGSVSAFWWRLPSAISGIGTVWLVMQIVRHILDRASLNNRAEKLAKQHQLYGAAFAGLIAATDGLLLVQSRIAMNDAVLGFLFTLGAWLVIRERSFLSGRVYTAWQIAVVLGLAMATKWTGIFVWILLVGWLAGMAVWHFVHHSITQRFLIKMLFIGILPWIIYFLLYAPAALSHHGYAHVIELHRQTWLYQLNRDANHAYASVPWQWLGNVRPVWYWQDRRLSESMRGEQVASTLRANIYAVSHPLLPVFGLLALWSIVHGILAQRWRGQAHWQIIFLLSLYGATWIPWLFSPRIMFYYHYMPAVPFLAILIGVWQSSLLIGPNPLQKRIFWILVATWCIGVGIWLPHWLGLRVPKILVDTIYFGLPGWR